MPFAPGDPWPDTTYQGGAVREGWSGYIRLIVQAQIAGGSAFALGQSATDNLNAGNVLVDASSTGRASQLSGLWVDLTPDLTALGITLGATSNAGILSKAEAGTLTATLYDPTGKYDPLNPETPYALGGQSRLVPGVPIRAFCEVINSPGVATVTVNRYPLFTGTADQWQEPWRNEEGDRFCDLVATDTTKQFVKMDAPEQSPVGDGDGVQGRLTRIKNLFAWPGSIYGTMQAKTTFQATTLAQQAWEMVNRTLDDELGFVYFMPVQPAADQIPALWWWDRGVWSNRKAPSIILGCSAAPGWYDVVTDAQPVSFDALLHNTVYAARSGGSQQIAQNSTSVTRYGIQSLQRTDLGHRDDAQVASWAQAIVAAQAYPQTSFDHLTLEPAVEPDKPWTLWSLLLQMQMPRDTVRVVRDRAGYVADVICRPVGWKHTIDPWQWTVELQTVRSQAVPDAIAFHVGPDTRDRLDSGYQLTG